MRHANGAVVIVFSDRAITITGHDALRTSRTHLVAAAAWPNDYDKLLSALIDAGMFESACADAECPTEERRTPLLAHLREVSEEIGTAFAAARVGDATQVRAAIERAVRISASIDDAAIAGTLSVSVPEGYAFYSLYPESYVDAVIEWAKGTRPERVVCIGLRSIGTSLSAVVAGALRLRGVSVCSWTVRPRGHPFDRHVRLGQSVTSYIDARNAVALIVDEGPGLSGSSLAAAATAFSDLGTPDERIVLMPSSSADPDRFVSSGAAARWRRHTVIVPHFAGVRRMLADERVVAADALEISAGSWREHLGVLQPWPAVQPQHERRKFLNRARDSIVRFAGLGPFGARALDRATALADAGWTAPPAGVRRGFLRQPLIVGRQMSAGEISGTFLAHAATYVGWLRRHASRSDVVRAEPLAAMLQSNTKASIGDDYVSVAAALSRTAETFDEPATAIDGRLMPHEWVRLDDGSSWIKTDALDHHCDHFLPGCTDAAWDVAGAIVELSLDERGQLAFVNEYVRRSGDGSITHRLPFYLAAYCAFRTGYCRIAAQTLRGTADGQRFEQLEAGYRTRLRATLAPNVRRTRESAGGSR